MSGSRRHQKKEMRKYWHTVKGQRQRDPHWQEMDPDDFLTREEERELLEFMESDQQKIIIASTLYDKGKRHSTTLGPIK